MSDLKLNPSNILQLASDRMRGLASDADNAARYARNAPAVHKEGWIYQIALDSHESVVTTAAGNASNSESLKNGVADNLESSHTIYTNGEVQNYDTVKDMFGGLADQSASSDPLGAEGGSASFGTNLPGEHIPAPAATFDAPPGWASLVAGLGSDLISPTYWITLILDNTIGVNPLEWCAEQIAGDWRAISEFGSALTNLSQYWQEVSDELKSDANVLFAGWQGEASGTAQEFFHRLIDAHSDQVSPLKNLGHEYDIFARGMFSLSETIVDLLSILTDKIIQAAATAAAGAVAGATGIGGTAALVCAVISVSEIGKIIRIWQQITDLIETGKLAATGLSAAIGTFAGVVNYHDQLTMPSAP